jgi:hypothetical protein
MCDIEPHCETVKSMFRCKDQCLHISLLTLQASLVRACYCTIVSRSVTFISHYRKEGAYFVKLLLGLQNTTALFPHT